MMIHKYGVWTSKLEAEYQLEEYQDLKLLKLTKKVDARMDL